MNTIVCILLAVNMLILVLVLVILLKLHGTGNHRSGGTDDLITALQQYGDRVEKGQRSTEVLVEKSQRSTETLVEKSQNATKELLAARLQDSSERITKMEQTVQQMSFSVNTSITKLRDSNEHSLELMRQSNEESLAKIRKTVDDQLAENLEKRISTSFETVAKQLEAVYRGLGEMQTIASDVGGLKRVLSNVKSRGILGEYQCGAILEQILSPEQYDRDVATISRKKNPERVEFAVKLPGTDGGTVYLPIDSKFPGESYAKLQAARETGNKQLEEEACKNLILTIRAEAKDICEKYVEPPYTTRFGLMFLPFEGLYAEVVSNVALCQELQTKYNINVVGPSTLAAFLNSLQAGFQTLAIQKKSAEIGKTLAAVKTEFMKFDDLMETMEKHLKQTETDLDRLRTTRSRAIMRQLRDVETLEMIPGSEGPLSEE